MVTENKFDDFDRKLDELLRLPRFSPSVNFANQVMAQVAVFAPKVSLAAPPPRGADWALPPALTRWIPRSRPARYAAGVFAVITSAATTGVATLVVTQFGLLNFLAGIAADRLKFAATLWGGEVINSALGQPALGYVTASGTAESAFVFGALAAGGIAAFAVLKKAAALQPGNV